MKTLLRDANVVVEVNGGRSHCFELSRSIRQGCPLAPTLFVIATEALHYLLRDDILSPKVRGPLLPNMQEISKIQFVDDTTILFKLDENNMKCLIMKLDLFMASGSKIFVAKSILLGWDPNPPLWCDKYGISWGGPCHIVQYLGIPFSINPNINDMQVWLKEKISGKLLKWNNMYFSLARRIQVCQKMLSSYSTYFSLACVFNVNQIAST